MIRPEEYAKQLMKAQGPEKAYEMAVSLSRICEVVGKSASPFAEEVERVEQTTKDKEGKATTKTVMVIDELAKEKRLAKTKVFWDNVAGYIKNRKPKRVS